MRMTFGLLLGPNRDTTFFALLDLSIYILLAMVRSKDNCRSSIISIIDLLYMYN